jgi:hypothetical protein
MQKSLEAARTTLRSRWEKTTWGRKRTVWHQWEEFLRVNRGVTDGTKISNPEDLLIFLEGLDVSLHTRHKYGCELRLLLRELEVQIPSIFDVWITGMGRLAADEDETSAPPITRDLVEQLLMGETHTDIKMVVWLAWKTASRIAEVLALRKGSFLAATKTEGVLFFGWKGGLKTAKKMRQRWQIQNFCHLLDRFHPELMEELENRVAILPNHADNLFLVTHARVLEALKHNLPPPTPQSHDSIPPLMAVGLAWSGHSIKNGALRHLEVHMPGTTPNRDAIMSLMAKHKDPRFNRPGSTVRYLRAEPEQIRRAGTGVATLLL